jgi:hypothetical protein
MMIIDVSKLNIQYLKLVEENFTYEMNQLKYKMNYIQNSPVVSELFIKLKYIKPKKFNFKNHLLKRKMYVSLLKNKMKLSIHF